MNRLILLLLICGWSTIVRAQYDFINYQTTNTGSNGLLDNTVTDICKDADGRYWFSQRWEGISIYDGVNWETIKELDGTDLGEVVDLFLDSQNNIWISSGVNVILKFDGTTITTYPDVYSPSWYDGNVIEDKFHNIWTCGTSGVSKFDGVSWSHYSSGSLESGDVTAIASDTLGNIWAATSDWGVRMFDGNSWTSFTNYALMKFNTDIHVDRNNKVWVATSNGAITYDGANWSDYPQFNAWMSGIEEDNNGVMYFSDSWGSNGLYEIANGTRTSFNTGNSNIIGNKIRKMVKIDNEIWLIPTLLGGVCSYVNGVFSTLRCDGLIDNSVYTIYQDNNLTYWFGTGHNTSSLNNGIWKSYFGGEYGINSNAIQGSQVYAINQIQPNQLLFQTNFYVSALENNNWTWRNSFTQTANGNTILFKDRLNNLWFSDYNGVYKFDGSVTTSHIFPDNFQTTPWGNERIPHLTSSMVQDQSGNIYVGDNLYGLRTYDGNEWSLNDTILGIKSMFCDSEANLWLGTETGLIQINDLEVTVFTQQDGLLSDIITSVLVDDIGRLWVGTSLGLNMLDSSGTWKSFESVNNLLSYQINQIYQDVYGHIWFCTANGVVKLRSPAVEIDQYDLLLFPNPCTDILNFTASITNFSIEIFDLLGKKIYEGKHADNFGQIELNGLRKGSYIMRVYNDSKTTSKSFIKLE